MVSVVFYIALAIFAVAFYVINKLRKKYNYFKDRAITQLEPNYFYGNGKELLQHKVFQGFYYRELYNKFKKMGIKHGGIYLGSRPIWVPIDPELIKFVIIRDFNHFTAHIPKSNFLKSNNILFKNLFIMDGDEWKDMRRKLTPTFTTGKMKMMFNILLEKINGLSDLVGEMAKTGEAAEIKKLLSRFTTDVIGSCGFGIECDSMKDENSEFFIQGQNTFKGIDRKPSLFKLLLLYLGIIKVRFGHFESIDRFFRNVVKETIDYREKNKIVRKDFLHLMIQLKNKGVVTELTNENEDVYQKTVHEEVMSLEDIAGQCLLFFNAGFETSSTTMTFALLELTQYPELQKKIRAEVRDVLKKHDGNMTYDVLQEMTYLDGVVYETLRKYPPVATLPRICTKDYTIPGTNSVITKGTSVNVPVWGLHMDPENFPEPEKFIPERFSTENKRKIKDMTFLPFGEGPRMCLGLRFGVMQSKAGLAALLKDYQFTLDKRSPYPPVYQPTVRIITIIEGGVWLKATKVD